MFKKLTALCLGCALCFGFIGCGDSAPSMPETTQEAPSEEPGEADMSKEAPT